MFKRIIISIRNNILMGFFLTVPVVATIIIFNFIFKLTTDWLPDNRFLEFRTILAGYPLRILTLLAVIIVLYFVGLLTRNFFGRRLYQLGDKIMESTPLIKGIYVSVRQISQSLFTQRKTLFKEVVLVQYPRKGLYSLAFITADAPPSVAKHMGGKSEECVSLFISTTPNPTSGVFILVPKSEITPLDMPVADALTFIMSAGAVAPGDESTAAPTLLDKLESWMKRGGDSPSLPEKTDGAENTQ